MDQVHPVSLGFGVLRGLGAGNWGADSLPLTLGSLRSTGQL